MLGYLLSAVAYGLLLAAALTLWRKRLAGSGLALALSAQLAWSIVTAVAGRGAGAAAGLTVGIEYLRDLAWAVVLLRSLRASGHVRALRTGEYVVEALALLVIFGLVASRLPQAAGVLAGRGELYGLWGRLCLSIAGLVLVEQLARNTRAAYRWALKYVWLAVGAIYACDLWLAATAMLHGHTPANLWAARGFINAGLAAVLAVGMRRVPPWRSAAFLSPRVVFFNATLLGAALYVFVMAIGSYYVRRLGGSWGATGELVFLAAGVLLLSVAVLSERLRAQLRVAVGKRFSPYRYDYRAEWRKLTRALSERGSGSPYERIVEVMAGFLTAPEGGLWLEDPDGAWVPAGGSLAPPDAPREAGSREFFAYLLEREWIFDLDAARRPRGGRLAAPPPPPWMLAQRSLWLIVPLICEGALIGFVGIGHPLAPVDLTWEEIDLLRAAGRQVASYLAFEQAAKRLAQAQQFEAMNRLSAVILHDLRHLIAQQALVVENAARHRGNPRFFDDAILTIEHSVKRMTRLMEELRGGVLASDAHRVELNELCAEVVRRCAGAAPVPSLAGRDRRVEALVNRDRMLQVLEHVVRNAQQATAADGLVTLTVGRSEREAVIEIADSGCGMDAEFVRNRLFRPFDSTKGEQGFGLGAYQAREFVRKCGGRVEVKSAPGAGTTFAIHLPLAPALDALAGGTERELET